jgi:hypothetical protein
MPQSFPTRQTGTSKVLILELLQQRVSFAQQFSGAVALEQEVRICTGPTTISEFLCMDHQRFCCER